MPLFPPNDRPLAAGTARGSFPAPAVGRPSCLDTAPALTNVARVNTTVAPVHGDRSATLAAWVRSWRAGLISVDDAIARVVDGRAEHVVDRAPGSPDVVVLGPALTALARTHPDAVRLVLPAPGDPRGLPGPGPLCTAALAAGEAVLCPPVGLVPEATRHLSGSGDAWEVVRWRVHPVPAGTAGLPDPGEDLDTAAHGLLAALHDTTDVLHRLDIGRSTPAMGAALAALRRGVGGPALPPGYGSRSRQLLARATTVAAIVALAATDAPGGAATAGEAAERDTALRPLAAAARRARMAAVNAPLDRLPPGRDRAPGP